ncbi:hypothetical protein [Mesorhizobium sp. SP-1A]|uniref:hypothetical protein n=1 Tax=Mesorhizobium sp. SP-1A TaxID=3077840 RepID=UPI0028F6DB86|nr:hypothetical protein [Mesorhizobium sp. SP-1A]
MHRIIAAAFTVLFLAPATVPAMAQALGSNTEKAIVGADVKQEETTAAAKEDKVVAAIEKTAEALSAVRKTSSTGRVDIVFLSDAAREKGGGLPPRIEGSLKKHEGEITQLRQEIEANALLYHAIESQRVQAQDVVAVDFGTSGRVVIYAAAKPAG